MSRVPLPYLDPQNESLSLLIANPKSWNVMPFLGGASVSGSQRARASTGNSASQGRTESPRIAVNLHLPDCSARIVSGAILHDRQHHLALLDRRETGARCHGQAAMQNCSLIRVDARKSNVTTRRWSGCKAPTVEAKSSAPPRSPVPQSWRLSQNRLFALSVV